MYSSSAAKRPSARTSTRRQTHPLSSPFFSIAISLDHTGGAGGKFRSDARARKARAIRRGQQSLGHGAADDAHFRNARVQRALARFELQDHSTRNFILADEFLCFARRNDFEHF